MVSKMLNWLYIKLLFNQKKTTTHDYYVMWTAMQAKETLQ